MKSLPLTPFRCALCGFVLMPLSAVALVLLSALSVVFGLFVALVLSFLGVLALFVWPIAPLLGVGLARAVRRAEQDAKPAPASDSPFAGVESSGVKPCPSNASFGGVARY